MIAIAPFVLNDLPSATNSITKAAYACSFITQCKPELTGSLCTTPSALPFIQSILVSSDDELLIVIVVGVVIKSRS